MSPIKHFILAGIHSGHKANERNPKTAFFPSAPEKKSKIHIIDLEQSILMMRRALNFIGEIYEKRGSLFCVGGGTNTATLFSIDRKAKFQSETQSTQISAKGPTGSRETLGSKQRRRLRRKSQMSSSLNRREKITALAPQVTEDLVPRALLILDPSKNAILVKEGIKLQLPVIAILDNKCDPSGIQYPIPGNGANLPESLELYILGVTNAIRDGKRNEMRKI